MSIAKIISGILALTAVFTGLKQGYAMITLKPIIADHLLQWGFNKTGVISFGILTIISSILILFPRTFFVGNFLMALIIFGFLIFNVKNADLKSALIEFSFLLLNLILIYLDHPFKK